MSACSNLRTLNELTIIPNIAAHRVKCNTKAIHQRYRRSLIVSQASQSPPAQQEKVLDRPSTKLAQTATTTSTTPASRQPPSGLTRSLRNLLRWSNVPLANSLEQPSDIDLAELSDGMAAVLTTAETVVSPLTATSSSSIRARASSYWRNPITNTRRKLSKLSAVSAPPQSSMPASAIDHASLAVLRERVASGSRPGQRTDNFKLGLVVEGGGMRGSVSAGGLQALSDLGLHDAFDAVYGSSAGAINATYFLSKQRDGVSIYHDHIACPEFIDIKRMWSRQPNQPPALNLEFLIDHVMEKVVPLDWQAVLESEIPLKVVASSLDTLEPVLLHNFVCKNDLAGCLRASANVPEVAGGPRFHRNQRLVDAAVFEAVPFRSAIADGCTHVIVLCTRPKQKKRSTLDRALADAVETAVKRVVMSPDYMVPAWQAELECLVKDGMSQDDMLLRSFDDEAHALPWFAGAHVFPIYPDAGGSTFSPLCIDVPTLKAGVAEGRRCVLEVMKAALGGVMNFASMDVEEQYQEDVLMGGVNDDDNQEMANIMPLTQLNNSIALERMRKQMNI